MLPTVVGLLALMVVVSGGGIDEDIVAAAESSDALSVLQPNRTVRIELDLMIPTAEYVEMRRTKRSLVNRYKRKGVGDRDKHWPGKTVPFEIKACFPSPDLNRIYTAMADYHRYTCVRWRLARSGEKSKAQFQDDSGGCYAYPGCYHTTQPINLSRGCRRKGTIIHEMGHTLGMYHEQSRPDRDDYIRIHKENMMYGTEGQFSKASTAKIPDWGVKYDYESVMHYGDKAFSRNRKRTITALDSEYQSRMGNRVGFAFSDIKMINVMYQCNEHCTKKPKCPGNGFVGKDCKCWCKGKSLKEPVRYCNGGGAPTDPGPEVEHDRRAPTNCGSTVRPGGGGGGGGRTRPSGNCKDKVSDCHKHVRYCTDRSWSTFMKDNCQRTCELCQSDESEEKTTSYMRSGGGCQDGHPKCAQFAKQGECLKNLAYMGSVCARSCGLCSKSFRSSNIGCKDTNPYCKEAAADGLCDVETVTMHAECKKSCKLC